MAVTGLLLEEALAIQEDLARRIAGCPGDQSLQQECNENTVLLNRLIQQYRVEITSYLSRLSKSQFVF